MIDQPNKVLLKIKESKDLTYDKCYKYLKKYFIKEDSFFKKSDKLNDNSNGEIVLGCLCEIEGDLNINIWDEDLSGLNTINDLTLLVFHELLYDIKYNDDKYKMRKKK